jgi:hypothetical protein
MSNKMNRGIVLVGVLAATMIVAGGCADLSDLNDPQETTMPYPVPPETPEFQNRLDPSAPGPQLDQLTTNRTKTPVKPTPPSKQVLQVQKGGKLIVKQDEQLAQGISGDTTLELWVWIKTMADQPLVRMGNVTVVVRDRRVRVELVGGDVESDPVVSGEWYHVAVVAEADQLRLYVNGHMSGSMGAPTEWTLDDETITFGGQAKNKELGAFSGKLDNIRLTNQALYHDEDFTPSQQLVALDNMAFAYDFDQQREGEEVEDLSGNDRRGQIVGEAAMVGGAI